MPNTAKINGFRPVRYLNGAPWNGQARTYVIPSGNGVATAVGDVVIADTAAKLGYPACIRMTNGTAEIPLGVIVGILPIEPMPISLSGASAVDLNNLYRAASTEKYVLVVDDPNVIFEAEFEDAAFDPTQASVGGNYDIDLGSGTNTTTGASSMSIDTTAAGAITLATPLRLIELVKRPDNDITDSVASQRGLVIFNMHAFAVAAGRSDGLA